MSDTAKYSQLVPAADRALHALELVSGSPTGIGTADLLEEVGGSRSGLYAILNTLRSRGYVSTDDGVHRVGPSLRMLIPARPVQLEAIDEAFRSIAQTEAYEETTALVWPDGSDRTLVAENPGTHPVRVAYTVGARRLTDSPDDRVMRASDESDDRLDAVRRDGFSLVEGEGLVEVAAPVCLDGVRPDAAVLIGLPLQRSGEKSVEAAVDQVRQLGARISYRLGASVYKPYGWAARDAVGATVDLEDDEIAEFLGGLWSAQLACVRPDGTPHVVPLWYEWDGSDLWFAASPGSSWSSHVVENPEVSMTLDEPWPPLRRVFVSGTARIVSSSQVPGGLAGLRRRLAIRYLGRGAENRPEMVDVEGWSAVRVSPSRLHGRKGLGLAGLESAS